MKLAVFREATGRFPISRFQRLFDLVVSGEGKSHWLGTVNLIMTTDARIRTLNRRFRSRDRATDVLSFNIDPPEQPDAIFGEIYISAPCAGRHARRLGHGVWEEYLLLMCHGLLHLFGYDHAGRSDERAMVKRQTEYLAGLVNGK